MDEFNSVGGLMRSGEGGGSNVYYSYVKQQIKPKQTPTALKQGEILIGSIIEVLSEEIAKVKLPTGTFSASIHKHLKAGDTLYLFVKEVSPSLVLKVHSVSSVVDSKKLSPKDILRILDLSADEYMLAVAEYLSNKKSRIVRSEMLDYYSILSDKSIEKKRMKSSVVLEIVFVLENAGLSLSMESIESLYQLFLPIEDIYDTLRDIIRIGISVKSSNYRISEKDNIELFNITQIEPPKEFTNVWSFLDSYHYFNDFIRSKSSIGYHFFCIKQRSSFVLFKTSYIQRAIEASGYSSSNLNSVLNFDKLISKLNKEFLTLFENKSDLNNITLNSFVDVFSKFYISSGLQLSELTLYGDSIGKFSHTIGKVQSVVKNFSVVV